jgi:hypothetical protein
MRKALALAGAFGFLFFTLGLQLFYFAMSWDTAAMLIHKTTELGKNESITNCLKILSELMDGLIFTADMERGLPYIIGTSFVLCLYIIFRQDAAFLDWDIDPYY